MCFLIIIVISGAKDGVEMARKRIENIIESVRNF